MPRKVYVTPPDNYSVCLHEDCQVAAICLHRLVLQRMLKNQDVLYLVNPERCTKNETCSFYRNSKPVMYACGFKSFQEKMFPGQYRTFMTILKERFGRNGYFERRRGELPLSPKEQKIVLNALHRAGIAEDFKFDKYVKSEYWYD